MLPKCLCRKEMEFVMNNRTLQLYKCSCGRVMVRALSVPDIRAYYLPEKQTWPEDKVDGTQCAGDTVDKAIVTIGTPS